MLFLLEPCFLEFVLDQAWHKQGLSNRQEPLPAGPGRGRKAGGVPRGLGRSGSVRAVGWQPGRPREWQTCKQASICVLQTKRTTNSSQRKACAYHSPPCPPARHLSVIISPAGSLTPAFWWPISHSVRLATGGSLNQLPASRTIIWTVTETSWPVLESPVRPSPHTSPCCRRFWFTTSQSSPQSSHCWAPCTGFRYS